MKFLFAPDSFKGTLSALEVTKRLDDCAHTLFDDVQTILLPVADGGEGTVEALLMVGGQKHEITVTGPLGEPVKAVYGILHDTKTAVLEMAQAAGLPLVPPSRRDPAATTTQGVGEMLAHVLAQGYTRILIGLGGSATNDGGIGCLHALGARFYDKVGQEVPLCGGGLSRIAKVDLSGLHPALKQADITVMCDVSNPLLGEAGATAIYGPQKGGTKDGLALLEQGMEQYARVMRAQSIELDGFAGGGAAGGLGAALHGVLGAKMQSGIQAVLDAVHFETLLDGVDLVITGEGRLDGQSVRYGKVPTGVAERCGAMGVPVIALCGGMGEGAQEFLTKFPNSSIMTTTNAPMPLKQALADADALLDDAIVRLFRMIKIGMQLS